MLKELRRRCDQDGLITLLKQVLWGLTPHRFAVYKLKELIAQSGSREFQTTSDLLVLRNLRSKQSGLPSEFYRDEQHTGWEFLAATSDDGLLGIVWWHNDPCGNRCLRLRRDDTELTAVLVLPSARGKGIAKGLLYEACRRLRKEGLCGIYAVIHVANSPSLRAFEAVGFAKVAELHRFGFWGRRYVAGADDDNLTANEKSGSRRTAPGFTKG